MKLYVRDIDSIESLEESRGSLRYVDGYHFNVSFDKDGTITILGNGSNSLFEIYHTDLEEMLKKIDTRDVMLNIDGVCQSNDLGHLYDMMHIIKKNDFDYQIYSRNVKYLKILREQIKATKDNPYKFGTPYTKYLDQYRDYYDFDSDFVVCNPDALLSYFTLDELDRLNDNSLDVYGWDNTKKLRDRGHFWDDISENNGKGIVRSLKAFK